MITKNMAKSNKYVIKKSRGRPATGQGTFLGVRVQPALLEAIDAWIESQKDPSLTRPEAVRRLTETGLKAKIRSGT